MSIVYGKMIFTSEFIYLKISLPLNSNLYLFNKCIYTESPNGSHLANDAVMDIQLEYKLVDDRTHTSSS